MPRNVRNFWIELEVDGKKQKIATGPVSKTGGFQLKILVRENDVVSSKFIVIDGSNYPSQEGKCNEVRATVFDGDTPTLDKSLLCVDR